MTSPYSDVSFLRTWGAPFGRLREQAAVAVVIPTTLRPSLARALTSVFAQEFGGRVHVLIGIDVPEGTMEMLDAACRLAPSQCIVQALYPGYSTSVRHNGWWDARDGGALRTILSYLANAPLIAYLDDDNWWGPRHLATLARAIEPVDWAFSLRWFVHPETARPICVDQWESVDPDAGIFRKGFDGFVDPNCLMIKTKACAQAIPWWTVPLPGDPKGMSADRQVFDFLRRHYTCAGTGEASAFYVLNPADGMHSTRLQLMGNAYRNAGAPTATLPLAEPKQDGPALERRSPSAQEVFSDAVQHHQAERLIEAEHRYRQVLRIDPCHADSLDLLGVIAYQTGRPELAVDLIGKAITLKAETTSYYSDLGVILAKQGRLDESISCYRRAIDLKPDYPEAHSNLGIALAEQGRQDEAAASYRRAIELKPDFPEAHSNLGIELKEQGYLDEAVASYRRAIELKPDFPEAHTNLGIALAEQGHLDEAVASYRRAIDLKPDYPEAHTNLGIALKEQGHVDEAVASYRRAIDLKPDYPEAHTNLGIALKEQGHVDEAIASYRRAIDLKPDYPEAHTNLGIALNEQGGGSPELPGQN